VDSPLPRYSPILPPHITYGPSGHVGTAPPLPRLRRCLPHPPPPRLRRFPLHWWWWTVICTYTCRWTDRALPADDRRTHRCADRTGPNIGFGHRFLLTSHLPGGYRVVAVLGTMPDAWDWRGYHAFIPRVLTGFYLYPAAADILPHLPRAPHLLPGRCYTHTLLYATFQRLTYLPHVPVITVAFLVTYRTTELNTADNAYFGPVAGPHPRPTAPFAHARCYTPGVPTCPLQHLRFNTTIRLGRSRLHTRTARVGWLLLYTPLTSV